MNDSKTDEMTVDKIDVKMPGKYNVVFHNDNVTPIGFVCELLVNVFSYDRSDALRVVMTIEQDGKGIVGTYIKSIADAKATVVRMASQKAEYPLNVTVEPA